METARLLVLERDECLALVESVPIGRIVYTDRVLPAVQPVGFVLDAGLVVIRTAAHSKLAAAARDTIVAFEADEFDERAHTGWSVTLVGYARVVSDPAEIDRLSSLPLASWSGGGDLFLVVHPEQITGRRIAN
jgi:nitroimidazol reductase NimA-like FMN-containing flavoprotein (pyridoxamine 5'-phosphate oxidase superfamily)